MRSCKIASLILAEVEDEERWEDLFSRSEDVLAKLATSAMAEYHAGETQELDPETLWNQELHLRFVDYLSIYRNKFKLKHKRLIVSLKKIPTLQAYALKGCIKTVENL